MGAGPDAGHPVPVTPGQGPGWAQVAAAVQAAMPPAEIETIYLFRPIKREGREWGTAVVTRKSPPPDGRLRVYTAKYMLIVRGKERGQSKVEVVEVGRTPAEVLAQVMQATADRTGETEPPVEIGPGAWYEG
ncbi:MAG TPA: hypothetical protein VGJ83_00620 [Gemmatimonadales bacterium]